MTTIHTTELQQCTRPTNNDYTQDNLKLATIHAKQNSLLLNQHNGDDAPQECLSNEPSIYLLTSIGLSPGGSGYFTCIQNMKSVNNKFRSGGLHENR